MNTQSSQLDYDQLVTQKKEMKSKIKKQSSDLKQFKEVIATQQLQVESLIKDKHRLEDKL